MSEFPRIRIELEGVRSTVQTMLTRNNDDINNMVISSLEKQINEEWVQDGINNSVRKCLESAIDDIASDWNLKSAISKQISLAIEKMISQKES